MVQGLACLRHIWPVCCVPNLVPCSTRRQSAAALRHVLFVLLMNDRRRCLIKELKVSLSVHTVVGSARRNRNRFATEFREATRRFETLCS